MHFQGILNINRSSLLTALKFTAFPDKCNSREYDLTKHTFCFVKVADDSPMIEASKKGRKLAIYEAPKAQNYFHLEYKLLPDDIEPVKTDVVMYGVAAKIYNENDSKVMKTWKEGNKIWIAWTQR